jgi:hypothetical protein
MALCKTGFHFRGSRSAPYRLQQSLRKAMGIPEVINSSEGRLAIPLDGWPESLHK